MLNYTVAVSSWVWELERPALQSISAKMLKKRNPNLHPFIERCAPGFQFTGCRTCQHSTCIDIYSYQHLQVLPSCFCSVKCMSPVPAVLILPQVPVRSRQCQHSACFDLSSYLHLRAAAAKAKREGGRAQAARCPLCMSELHWEALFCDGLS